MKVPFSFAYLAGEPRALPLLPADFRDREARRRVAQERATQAVAPALLAELREQAGPAPGPARAAHLDALGTPGTTAVVTGQQVGLFLGPLYTVFKAASAIAAARLLEAETGRRCVPLFWLQTEDHDWAEIDHCDVLRPGREPFRLQLGVDEEHPRASVAHRRLGADVEGLLTTLEEHLGDLPHGAEFLALLRAHYRPGASPGAAFAGVLSALFHEEGLVVLDPRRPAVAELAAPLYRQALLQAEAIDEALLGRGRALQAAGFDEQVPVRRGSALVFFHQDGVTGPRYRLERSGEGWVLSGSGEPRPLPTEELLAILAREPLRFSTSALLRPLVQDALLPTACYLGGPGELNYFAQLPPLYELLGIAPPLFAPRSRFRCLEDNTRALLQKLGLRAADAEQPRDVLRRRCGTAVAELPEPEAVRGRLLDEVTRQLEELGGLDPALREPSQQARQSVERTLGRLVERYEKVRLGRDQVTSERVDRLPHFLFPGGSSQERFASVLSFVARHGVAHFKERLFSCLVPFDATLRDLEL